MKEVAIMSGCVAVITGLVAWLSNAPPLTDLALFCGLEGTVLLASMLAPPPGDLRGDPKHGIIAQLLWPFTEGRGLSYPIHYNPIYYRGGLLLLAVSMVLSAIE